MSGKADSLTGDSLSGPKKEGWRNLSDEEERIMSVLIITTPVIIMAVMERFTPIGSEILGVDCSPQTPPVWRHCSAHADNFFRFCLMVVCTLFCCRGAVTMVQPIQTKILAFLLWRLGILGGVLPRRVWCQSYSDTDGFGVGATSILMVAVDCRVMSCHVMSYLHVMLCHDR